MKILVDSREPQTIFNLLDRFNIEYEKTKLDVGDFLSGDVCIERKTIADFVTSLRGGHLQKQLLQMGENYKRNYLIISGDFKSLHFNPHIKNWTINHHIGALASINVRYNTKVIQVANDSQLVQMVEKINKKSHDGKIVTIRDTELMKQTMTWEDVKIRMLCCIPDISLGRAEALVDEIKIKLLDKNGLPLTFNYLYTIPGIGEVLAENIIEASEEIL